MAIACAVARIALWSGFWNSDRRLARCSTMGAIDLSTLIMVLSTSERFRHSLEIKYLSD